MTIFLTETLEAKSMPSQMAIKVKDDPKSGCLNTSRINGEIKPKLLKILFQLAVLLAQNEARAKIKTGLANSEGWILKKPKGIHLIAPLVSTPKIATIIKSKIIRRYKGLINFAKACISNCDNNKKNTNPTPVKTSC